jgi:hypothetical protein
MPTMADIVVKKADNTTNVTYSSVTASGGEKSPAVWRDNSFAGTIGQRPELRIKSSANGAQSARKVSGSFTYPSVYTDTTTSQTKVAYRSNVSFDASVSMNMTDAQLAEFAAQFGNAVASALVRSVMASGYAPT